MKESCETCKYYDPHGLCRRFPPTVVVAKNPQWVNQSLIESYFPAVGPQDWCGEYKEKK